MPLNTVTPNFTLSNYKIVKPIGEGGYGIVYKALQLSTGQTVAIKVLKLNNLYSTASKKQLLRFETETQLCAEINHPNIVKLIDKGYSKDDIPFAVFEYISGQNLKELIQQKKGLSPEETGYLMGQVLDGLISAHAKGIAHRDLKPHNIMITKTENRSYVKILDFGTSSFTLDFINNREPVVTATKEVLGTPAYSAPEQLRGEPITTKSDLYAWGLILLECLTGKPVIYGDSIAEIFQKQLDNNPILIPSFIAMHPISSILKEVLQKDTYLRNTSALKIAEKYFSINFNTIVGETQSPNTITSLAHDITQANQIAWQNPLSEKRQLTVLCLKLNFTESEFEDSSLDLETLEMVLKDQLQFCKDIGLGFGAHVSGIMADTIIMYFGYPLAKNNDVRRAGRTALELVSLIQKRNALLKTRYKTEIDIRVTLNTGAALIKHKSDPEGLIINTAFNLLYSTPPGAILVGPNSKKLLDPYLDFKPFKTTTFTANKKADLYILIGEHRDEAFSNLSLQDTDKQIIGRENELQQLCNLWNAIDSTFGKVVLIKGQPGIGKSKLVFEAKKKVINNKLNVRECNCQPEYQNNALYPVFELIKEDLGFLGDKKITPKLENTLRSLGCNLEKVIPVLCSWFGIPLNKKYTFYEIPSSEQKEILYDTLEKIILHIDSNNKFLIIVEDLHWIDPTSMDFFNKLSSNIQNKKLLILFTTRSEFINKINPKQLTSIELKPLDNLSELALIKEVIKQKKISKEALEYIRKQTDGVPLFINDFTQMLLEKKYLIEDNNIYHLASNFEKSWVPITLEGLLNSQLDSIGFAKVTAQLAATIGREFNYHLLLAASINEESVIQQNLKALIDAKLIYTKRNVQNEVYIFRHALIRDAAYDRMLNSQKKEIHLRIAKALPNAYNNTNSKNALIASHYEKAGVLEQAIDFYTKAGEEANQKSVFEEASILFEKALTITEKLISTDEAYWKQTKLKLLVQKSIALKPIKGWTHEEVIDLYNQAYEIGLELNAHKIIAPVTFGLWVKHLLFLELDEALRFAKSYFNTAKELNEIGMILEAKISVSNTHFWLGNISQSLQIANEVFEDFDNTLHKDNIHEYGQDPRAFAYLFKILCLNILGEDVTPLLKEALDWAESLNHPYTKAIILQLLAWIHFQNNHYNKAKNACDELKALSENNNFKLYKAVSYLFSVPYYIANKDFTKAKKYLNIAFLELLKEDDILIFHSVYYLFKCQIETRLLKLEKALKSIEYGINKAIKQNEMTYYPLLLNEKALVLRKLNQHSKATNTINDAKRFCEQRNLKLFLSQLNYN